MAKGDIVLLPVVLEHKDPVELGKLVAAERLKREQMAAKAHYTSVYVPRPNTGNGFFKHFAFVEFMMEEK